MEPGGGAIGRRITTGISTTSHFLIREAPQADGANGIEPLRDVIREMPGMWNQ